MPTMLARLANSATYPASFGPPVSERFIKRGGLAIYKYRANAARASDSVDNRCWDEQVLPIYILLEEYKKAGLSAVQSLSVNLRGDFQVLAPSSCFSLVLASSFSQPPNVKPSRIVLDQVPADSPSPSTPKISGKRTLLTLHLLALQNPPSSLKKLHQ
ncbi:hypothetical protein ATANTOWER_021081, partial [Ataeniobius toweri]|nr:hypothetical protein [Ataeniobius toweri]